MGDLLKTGHGKKLAIILVLAALSTAGGVYLAAKYKGTGTIIPYTDRSLSHKVPPEDEALYAELNKRAATESAASLSEYIVTSTLAEPRKIAVALDWARDYSVRQPDIKKMNSLYFMLYSDLAFFAAQAFLSERLVHEFLDYSQTALAALMTFEMMLATDIVRCKDATAEKVRDALMAPRLKTLFYALGLFSPSEMENLSLSIVRGESNMIDRPPNAEVCAAGSEGSIAVLQQKDTKMIKMLDPENPSLTKTILVPPKDFKVKPEFVSDAVWAERRAIVREELIRAWGERYRDYTDHKKMIRLKEEADKKKKP